MVPLIPLLLASVVLCSAAYGQTVVTYKIPESLESFERKAELRYCFQWLSFDGGKVARGNLLLESLGKDKIEVPYRWLAAFQASLESDYQWLEGGGLNAAIVLPVRRKHAFDDVGEVLLLKNKLTISLVKSSGYGGGYIVPEAVLDNENCFVISNELKSQIVITNLESSVGTKIWETTIPLVYSDGGKTGPSFNDWFQDVRFLDRNGERVLYVWNHFAGEFMFAELDCKNGSMKTWFSSKIALHPNLTKKTRTK